LAALAGGVVSLDDTGSRSLWHLARDTPPGGEVIRASVWLAAFFVVLPAYHGALPGLAFVLWGRLALGRMYFVSTSFGAQLYADHQLVTHEPFAIVRHPMYSGLIAAGIGSLLLYQT